MIIGNYVILYVYLQSTCVFYHYGSFAECSKFLFVTDSLIAIITEWTVFCLHGFEFSDNIEVTRCLVKPCELLL